MKSSLLTIACLLFAVLFISTTPSASSQNTNSSTTQSASSQTTNRGKTKMGKRPKVVELKGTKAPASRGTEADPNIKNDKQTNDPNAQVDAPTKKGGATTRGGGTCEVRLDNRTPWIIRIFVDGTYRGTLSAYGDGVVNVLPGETTVYGRVDFDDGSYYHWGPNAYDCRSGQYIYFKMII